MGRLFWYFGIAYAISWTLWLPLYAPSLGLPSFPLLVQHALGAFGPLLSAVIVTAAADGRAGLVRYFRRTLAVPSRWWILPAALVGPFAAAAMAAGIAELVQGNALSGLFHSSDYATLSVPMLLAFYTLVFGVGEEFGWRGFALPELERFLPPIPSTLIVTAGWAIWHAPMFVYWPSFAAMGVGAAGWAVSLLLGSFILTLLVRLGTGSVLAAVLFHGAINTALAYSGSASLVQNISGGVVTLAGLAALQWLRRPSSRAGQLSRVAK